MNICICGGGNLGHVVAGYIASKKECHVSMLTRHPERWTRLQSVTLPSGERLLGTLAIVSKEPSQVIPQADVVLMCLPGMYIRSELERIKPFLQPTTVVGTVVSSTGFFFLAHDVLMATQPLFGFQRVPFIARTEQYGHSAHLLGFKKELKVVIEHCIDTEGLRKNLEYIFDTPVQQLDNYYEVSLSNSNPLLHTARLYSMWRDYRPGVFYPRQTLFYEEWTEEAAQLYIDMDAEFQLLLRALKVRVDSIPSVLKYYESTDASSLCHKIRGIAAFKGIKSPMIHSLQGWIPDFSSRYFTEDFGYGLRFIYDLAREKYIAMPHIETVYTWGEKQIEK